MAESDPLNSPARGLERYEVGERIAVGGMAEVFIAKAYGAHGFEKKLAIKRILPELAKDAEFEERFIAEAKVAVRLSHTNIVQVLDFGRFAGSLFIAMEYVDGLDLAALLRAYKDRGQLVPLPAAFHIAVELLRGLDYAHHHGVVHRDVSPSNILLSRAGEVKIADFGIAVAARPHKGSGGPGPRKVMGKWRYMSPEQTRGDNLDTRSDSFSAAAVIFELFTGEKLFPGAEAEDIIRNIHDMALPRPSSVRSGLPAKLDEILAGPLSRSPTDWPPRPAPVLRALTELSYESSIISTSLDVAEAVAAVLEPEVARTALDDVILQQLSGAGADAVRQTAVTGGDAGTARITHSLGSLSHSTNMGEATGLRLHRVGTDGMSQLEVDGPTVAQAPRARRITGAPVDADEALGPMPARVSAQQAAARPPSDPRP